MKTRINDFRFLPSGHGHYEVIYTSPVTGKKWRLVTNDMPLIDATKNEEYPKQKDLDALKRVVKMYGRVVS